MPISIDRAFHRVKEAFSIGELVSRSMMDFPSSSKKYFVVEEPFDVMNLHARFYQRFYSRFYGQTVPSISFLSPNFPPLCTCRENIEEIDRKNRGNSIKISRKRRGFLFVSFPSFFFRFIRILLNRYFRVEDHAGARLDVSRFVLFRASDSF